jgi:preprotein translocase subunit SecA
MAHETYDWEGAAERLEDACEHAGRSAELGEFLRAHPRPAPKALPSASTVDSFDSMPASRFDADADFMPALAPPQQLTRASVVGRNDPCPCGSGKKYKKCCLR